MDVNSIVSVRNYDILTSIIAHLLMSRPFTDSSRLGWVAGFAGCCPVHRLTPAESSRHSRIVTISSETTTCGCAFPPDSWDKWTQAVVKPETERSAGKP